MFCKDCGTELVNGACPKCTLDYVEEKPKKKKKGTAFAIVSMATGIASIIMTWGVVWSIILGIVALITGSIYKSKNGKSHIMVKVGIACGIIGIILQIVMIVVAIIALILYYGFIFSIFFGSMQ